MILEKVSEFHRRFALEHGNVHALLGVSFENLERIRFQSLQKGAWSHLAFADGSHHAWGVRIDPTTQSDSWAGTYISPKGSSFLFSPNLRSFLAMVRCESFQTVEMFPLYKDYWEQVSEVMKSAYATLGGEEYHGFLAEFISDDSNFPNNKEVIANTQKMFWETLDGGSGWKEYFKLVHNSQLNPEWVPTEVCASDLGIWRHRYFNALGTLAVFRDKHVDSVSRREFCWLAFSQPHGYDPEIVKPELIPSYSLSPSRCIESFVMELRGATDFTGLQNAKGNSPLFAPLVSLAGNFESYLGVQHFEAAVLWDLEFDEPLNAWESLVSAAYWSGRNSKETLLPAWQAAIELAEARGWSEAYSVLVDNWNFYIDFKRRNNIP